MSPKTVPALLFDLISHAEAIVTGYEQIAESEMLCRPSVPRDAILYNFIVLGEVAMRLGSSFQETHPEVPWRQVIAQRNILAHGYDIIDADILARTIERDIPELISTVKRLLAEYGPPPGT